MQKRRDNKEKVDIIFDFDSSIEAVLIYDVDIERKFVCGKTAIGIKHSKKCKRRQFIHEEVRDNNQIYIVPLLIHLNREVSMDLNDQLSKFLYDNLAC